MAPMSPAMTSSPNQLGGKVPSIAILASISAQTGVNCLRRPAPLMRRAQLPVRALGLPGR